MRGFVQIAILKFQSTPSAWRETHINGVLFVENDISIHSLRMEGDHRLRELEQQRRDFNPLPPHGGRPIFPIPQHTYHLFQSTPSAWRETQETGDETPETYISIHSLRMEGDLYHLHPLYANSLFQSTPSAWRETNSSSCSIRRQFISIHSLRMEGDPLRWRNDMDYITFQSTPSAWRETSSRTQS